MLKQAYAIYDIALAVADISPNTPIDRIKTLRQTFW